MNTSKKIGDETEQLARDYLKKEGYSIVEQNYRYRKAEVDIICIKESFLIVIEVKARSYDYFGRPETFVSKKKIKLLTEAINHYVETKNIDLEIRFDIISYTLIKGKWKLKHIKNAFHPFF